ncbi:MAG: hypothetical protein PVI24_04270 [Myxococcales bacterium]|jgi:hypothetical protein
MGTTRFLGPVLSLLVISCANEGGPVAVDATWNLTCPSGGEVDCGAPAPETCLDDGIGVYERSIVGEHGQTSCTGDPIIASCEAIDRSTGTSIRLEASVGNPFPDFAFQMDALIGMDGATVSACNVTIVEDQLAYDMGSCGTEPPSIEQPCQLSSISVDGSDISFDLQCESLWSSVTLQGFDVGATGGGPTTIRFANCAGF